MKNNSDYKPRLTIEITQEQFNRLQIAIPHGWRRRLFQAIIDDILEMVERKGVTIIALLVDRRAKISIIDITKESNEPKNVQI